MDVDLNRRWKETSIDERLNQVKWSDNVRDYIKHKIQNTEVDWDGAVMARWHLTENNHQSTRQEPGKRVGTKIL